MSFFHPYWDLEHFHPICFKYLLRFDHFSTFQCVYPLLPGEKQAAPLKQPFMVQVHPQESFLSHFRALILSFSFNRNPLKTFLFMYLYNQIDPLDFQTSWFEYQLILSKGPSPVS